MNKMPDQELIKLYFSRSEIAISETKTKYGKLILSVADGILHDMRDAEECESDTYMGLWNSIPPKHPQNFKAYCLKIARNLALKKLEYHSAERRDRNKTVSYEEITSELGDISDNNNNFTENELTETINQFLAELNPRERKVFVLRYWYLWSIKKIARNNNLAEGNVKTILFRTRVRLKTWLNERDYNK